MVVIRPQSAEWHIPLALALWILSLFCGVPQTSAESTDDKRHILLLNSYHQRMSWVQDIVKGVENTLMPDENNIHLHIENMDSKEFHSRAYFQSFKTYLEVKYADTKISLILSSDNNAYDFLREYRSQIFPDIPIVFCGVNNFDKDQIFKTPLITGAAEIFSADITVRLARQLIPDLQHVYIINDYLKTGRFWEADIRNQLQSQQNHVTFEYSEDLSLPKLLDKVRTFTSGSAILLGTYFSDKDGNFYTAEHIAQMISQISNVPVFCLVEFIIEEGVVGGQVISGYYQGQSMAKLAQQILAGADIEKIPVTHKGSNMPIFNYEQLKRFNLDGEKLPADALVIKRPFSFYAEYRLQIWIVFSLICVLLTVILLLFFNIQKKKKAELALRRSEKRLRQQADATWEALVIHENGVVIQANKMFEKLTGYSLGEVLGQQVIPLMFPEKYQDSIKTRFEKGDLDKYETFGVNKGGRVFPIEVRVRAMEYEGREVRVAAIRDLSERKRMEEQLAQSQKMEAIGTLAGGIAHDFNNILSAILGYAEILLLKKQQEPETADKLEHILHAGNRAKLLVHQILTFAHKSENDRQPLQLSKIVHEALELLRASLPSSIEIQTIIATNGYVQSDITKMHQVVMNLCTNAAKAMPRGGIIEVSLAEAHLGDVDDDCYPDLPAGSYLCLTVTDSGKGIAQENIAKIFDPFFTTEGKGKGTGLGLAVVHGIVKQNMGEIQVESVEREGTAFTVYLPKVECDNECVDETDVDLPRGTESIMLIDDEKDLINVGVETLSSLGYSVEGYSDSVQALTAFKENPDGYDLVITDLTMPTMSGEEVAQEILNQNPTTPIIICSGYSETFSEQNARSLGIRRFLVKPVSIHDLAGNVRDVLNNVESNLQSEVGTELP